MIGAIEKTYDYRDEGGTLLYQVVRYTPKDFRQRRPDGNGGWVYELNGTRRILYRLPELIRASRQDWVFVCEGEKDADKLNDLGFAATTSPLGANKWRPEFNQFFENRLVAILPDNDEPGRRHAMQVAASLHPLATEVRIVELPNLPDKGDVSDWFESGGTSQKLIELIDNTKPFVREKAKTQSNEITAKAKFISLETVEAKPIDWLWPNRLAANMLSMIVGNPGAGKSFLLSYIISTVTTGRGWIDGRKHQHPAA